jgi:plastocyanin
MDTNQPTPTPPANPSLWSRLKANPLALSVLVIGLLMLVLVLALALTNHKTTNTTNQAANNTQAAQTATMDINDTAFTPATLQVAAGTTVTWTNLGTKPHQVAADPYPKDDSITGFNSKDTLLPKDSLSFTFTTPGTYHLHDELNPLAIQGTVVVR